MKQWFTTAQSTLVLSLVRKSYYPNDDFKEKNPKLLLDDYVKFIRFGQWRIEQSGYGILAFITNHGYLDNPTFRGMRQDLMKIFSEIYILDLHGNSKKKEVCPDGSPDKNIFDIQQGVSIGIFVKDPNKTGMSKVYHRDLYGLRDDKYSWLIENDINSTEWKTVKPEQPFRLFKPQDNRLICEYNRCRKVTDIFSINSSGMNTLHDEFVIKFEKTELENMVKLFNDKNISDNNFREKYKCTT